MLRNDPRDHRQPVRLAWASELEDNFTEGFYDALEDLRRHILIALWALIAGIYLVLKLTKI